MKTIHIADSWLIGFWRNLNHQYDLPKAAAWLGILAYCAWFWVLVYYWIDSPLPGWISESVRVLP